MSVLYVLLKMVISSGLVVTKCASNVRLLATTPLMSLHVRLPLVAFGALKTRVIIFGSVARILRESMMISQVNTKVLFLDRAILTERAEEVLADTALRKLDVVPSSLVTIITLAALDAFVLKRTHTFLAKKFTLAMRIFRRKVALLAVNVQILYLRRSWIWRNCFNSLMCLKCFLLKTNFFFSINFVSIDEILQNFLFYVLNQCTSYGFIVRIRWHE